MNIDIKPGSYVIAVSGGVDSMVLLDLLAKQGNRLQVTGDRKKKKNSINYNLQPTTYSLIVAHYDHGIRPDSHKDRKMVQAVAERLRLLFVYEEGRLGASTSEAKAREARYAFLQKVRQDQKADTIITAHHQDDAIETAIINMLRGTNRRGLTSLKSQPNILRPMLQMSKAEILHYAKTNKIKWHEDSTNLDIKYLRNYVRLQIVPKLSKAKRKQLVAHIDSLASLNKDIDQLIKGQLKGQKYLDKSWFLLLSHNEAKEIMASWLRQSGITEIDKKRLELLVRAAKTYAPGKQIDINKDYVLKVSDAQLALTSRER